MLARAARTARPTYSMKILFFLCTVAASLVTAAADDFAAVRASMTWTSGQLITNNVGTIRQARTAPASPIFWQAWNTNKPAMKLDGLSARPTSNGWQAIDYKKGDSK